LYYQGEGTGIGCVALMNTYGGYFAIFHTYLENPMEWSQLVGQQSRLIQIWSGRRPLVTSLSKMISTLYQGVILGCVAIATEAMVQPAPASIVKNY
jgi:hypothetical protein